MSPVITYHPKSAKESTGRYMTEVKESAKDDASSPAVSRAVAGQSRVAGA